MELINWLVYELLDKLKYELQNIAAMCGHFKSKE